MSGSLATDAVHHDPLCASLREVDLFSAGAGGCDCLRFAEVRGDERLEAEIRVSVAAEINVKVKGVMCAVILRSNAMRAAGGAS